MKLLSLSLLCSSLFVFLAVGCESPESESTSPPETPWTVESDLIPFVGGKADGSVFKPHQLISDGVFEDSSYLSLDEIQGFFADTPYGHASFLSTYTWMGESAAQVIHRVSNDYRVNPLVLIAKLQVESSLVFRQTVDSFQVNIAMGCGCLDVGPACRNAPEGFGHQMECAAQLFRKYLNDQDETGTTSTGWGADISKQTSEGLWITPVNRATAALYTYTPWVLEGSGGNWLFWNVFRKFSGHVMKNRPNERWVGSLCEATTDCSVDEGVCMAETLRCNTGATVEGCAPENLEWTLQASDPLIANQTTGLCTRSCELYCPDSVAPYTASTFCAELPIEQAAEDLEEEPLPNSGWCLARCNTDLFPENNGCVEGTLCAPARRMNQPEVLKDVCWPAELAPSTDPLAWE